MQTLHCDKCGQRIKCPDDVDSVRCGMCATAPVERQVRLAAATVDHNAIKARMNQCDFTTQRQLALHLRLSDATVSKAIHGSELPHASIVAWALEGQCPHKACRRCQL